MKQLGWPRAPLLVGFVLTQPTEQYLWLSISRYGSEWLLRPGVIALGLLLFASVFWSIREKRRDKNIPVEESAEETVPLGKVPAILFTVSVLVVSAAALYEARSFPHLGALFPMAATIPAVVMAAIQMVVELRAARIAPGAEARAKIKLTLGYFVSLVLFLLLIMLLGFGIATALFTFVFLYGRVGMRWPNALIYTASLLAVVLSMGWLLGLHWPQGLVSPL